MAMPSVAVVGGSLGGLTAALVLRDVGCQVTVYERSTETLRASGAGIAVLEQTLRYPVRRLGVDPDTISTRTDHVRFLHADGSLEHAERRTYRFSAWNTIYRVLRSALPTDRYLLDWELTEFHPHGDTVDLAFANGGRSTADLLVCAQGISSAARQQMFPQVRPQYAGYVCWRGVIPETALTPATHDALCDALTYQVLPHGHILVYPIPGEDGSVQPGDRLVNMVWYSNLADSELPDLLTDRNGQRHRVSLPPGQARDEQTARMHALAAADLARPLAEVATTIPEPFVQAVFDIEVPAMRQGRACLVGDAAFAVRPHAAAGTAKAAEDAWILAEELSDSAGDVEKALQRWEPRQLALGADLLARTREIGDSSQFHGDFRPGDPRLVFGLYAPGR